MAPYTATSHTTQLERAFFGYSDWLSHTIIPFWIEHGFETTGGSVESFNCNGEINTESPKRSRVQARQMFVTAYAHSKGWTTRGREIIGNIDNYLSLLPRIEDGAFYPHLLAPDNRVIDADYDLYDCAFFLLAYAWRYKAFGDYEALKRADQLIAGIERQLRSICGGWKEGSYNHEIRRQNPHMHLFEAFMALFEATNNAKWMGYAGEMLSLFESRLYDNEHQVVREYFTLDWQPHPETGHILEPGHLMEWVWLLEKYSSITHKPLTHYSKALYQKAVQIGFIGKKRILINSVTADGKPIDSEKRLWPMTEWLKAALVMLSRVPNQIQLANDAIDAVSLLMENFSHPSRPEHYIDKLSADNQISDDTMPASTLYHLVTAHQVFASYIEQNT